MSVSPPRLTDADVVARVRPAVRAGSPYRVGGMADPPVKLNQNESPFDLPEELKREILEAFVRVPFNRYPSEQPGALAGALAAREGHPADGILVGNGSNELVFTLALAFVEPGVQVVLPSPMFALYAGAVRLHGGTVVRVPPRSDLSFDVDGIVRAMRATRSGLAAICSPNNPTGLALTPDEIRFIVSSTDGVVVIDEAYLEFNPYGSVAGLVERRPNLVVLRTLSKAFGLAGLRVGYLLARPALVAELLKARIPFMVNRLSQSVALSILSRPDLVADRVERIRKATTFLGRSIAELPGTTVLPSHTNFVSFRPPRPSLETLHGLAGQGVLVRDLSAYPELAGFLRVSAGLDRENRAFMTALKRTLGG